MVLGLVWWLAAGGQRPSPKTLDAAEAALLRSDFDSALKLADGYLGQDPQSSRALRIAGQASAFLNQDDAAFDYFDRVSESDRPQSAEALFQCGHHSLKSGRLSAAERYLKRAVAAAPQHVLANENLLYLLRVEGRLWELIPYSLALMREGRYLPDGRPQSFAQDVIDYVAPLGSTEWLWLSNQDLDYLEFCRQAAPGEPLALLGLGRRALQQNELARAREIFQAVLSKHPESLEAFARYGEVLLQTGGTRDFLHWSSQLPQQAESHPQIWTVRGLWAEKLGRPKAAARCYWEAILRDPNLLVPHYRLSQLLVALNRPVDARRLAKRAKDLAELDYLIKEVHSKPEKIRPLVELQVSLGRDWEAAAWCHVIVHLEPDAVWAKETIHDLEGQLRSGTGLTASEGQLGRQLDLSGYPLPVGEGQSPPGEFPSAGEASDPHVSFVEEAAAAGLNFTYNNGADPKANRASMFELSGGGIAVLDYDGDHWPDVYLTQGGRWPVNPEGQADQDRFFRKPRQRTF